MNAGSRIYLDHNATTPLRPAARDAMVVALGGPANASSVHGEGRAARGLVESARRSLAAATGAKVKNIVFTSGATEANVTVLTPNISVSGQLRPATRLFVGATEHASVLSAGRFDPRRVTILPVTGDGVIDKSQAERLVRGEAEAGGVPLVSVMAANNETGVVQPLAGISRIVRDAGGYLHVDAVQALGRIPVSIGAWDCDIMSVSSHKIGGPQGVGAIVYGRDDLRAAPLITGGGQEGRHRAGTENVAAIAGFGAALEELAVAEEAARITALRDWLEAELRHIYGDTVVFGRDVPRLPNTISFAVAGMVAETALIACDLAGAAVSSGSACSSGKVSSSHVLEAMGVPVDLARGALRLSLGWTSTREDVERFAEIWRGLVNRMKPAKAGKAA
ncbi:cysteine desulfurase [Breoghania corrubedonensis]|uniref:Cysteine desulfurase n=1 Tax=Breoghania corrubedonensis TaxID=665038 RepID=A0A2T5V9Y0_9HYPH|nr:cysteine desulfurase family protein [Breoghania corrubedonensis]PTW60566.1 cysteine desulfurase [Breoghania corrubedonensis]